MMGGLLVSLPSGGVVRVAASAGGVQATLLCERAGQLSAALQPLRITATCVVDASLVPLAGGLARSASGRRAAHLVLLERGSGAAQLHFGELDADSSAPSGLAWRCCAGQPLVCEMQEASLAAGCFADGPFFLAALPELRSLLVCAPEAPAAADSHLVARKTTPADAAVWRLALLRFPSPPLLLHAGCGLSAAVSGAAALLRLPAGDVSPASFSLVPLRAALSSAGSHPQPEQLLHFERLAAKVAPAELAGRTVCAAPQPEGGLALLLRDGEGPSLTLVQLHRGEERSRRALPLWLDEQTRSDATPAALLQLPCVGLEEEDEEETEEEEPPAGTSTSPLLLLAHAAWEGGTHAAWLLDLSPRAAQAAPLLPIATHVAAAIPLAGREAGLLLLPALGAGEGGTVPMDEGGPQATPSLQMLRPLPGCLGAARVLSTVRAMRACAGAAAPAGGEGVAAVAAALTARVEEAEEAYRREHARLKDKMALLERGRALMASCESTPPAPPPLQLAGGFSGGDFHVWATGGCPEGASLLVLPAGPAAASLGGSTSSTELRASVPAAELVAARRVAVLLCTSSDGTPMLAELGELSLEWGAASGDPPSAPPAATRSLHLLGSAAALRRLPRQMCDALGLERTVNQGEPGGTASASLAPPPAHPFLPPHVRLVISLPRDSPSGGAEATAQLSAADEGSLALLSGALLPALARAGVRAAPLRSSAAALEAARLCADSLAAELRAEDEEAGEVDALGRLLLQADTDAACAAMLQAVEGA